MTRVSVSECAVMISRLIQALEQAREDDCVDADGVIREAADMLERIRHE